MDAENRSDSIRDLSEEMRRLWNENAEWWDDKVGEGNDFQRLLIGPATERLLGLRAGELVLDCACGNGLFSRRLAHLGARVVAFDFSEKFLGRAVSKTVEHTDQIEYHLIDAIDEKQLLGLGKRRFDAAVCSMALMDMAAIEPLISALSQLLKPGGRFVFSVLHPCFNSSSGSTLMVEQENRDGALVTTQSVKVSRYIRPGVWKGLGIDGQPTPQIYFHRPMSLLFNTCFRSGFALDGMEEPVFEQVDQPERLPTWSSIGEIPPVLVARMRLVK